MLEAHVRVPLWGSKETQGWRIRVWDRGGVATAVAAVAAAAAWRERCADAQNKPSVLRAGDRAECGAILMSETCLSVIH